MKKPSRLPSSSHSSKPIPALLPSSKSSYNLNDSQALENLLNAEDAVLNEDVDAGDEDDDDDDDYDDEDDDDDDDEDEDDDINDDEEVMSGCPDYCRCVGQYAAATTARYVFFFYWMIDFCCGRKIYYSCGSGSD